MSRPALVISLAVLIGIVAGPAIIVAIVWMIAVLSMAMGFLQ